MTFNSTLRSFVPISQFNKGQASKIFERLKTEQRMLVLKNNAPAAVILSPEEYYRITEYEIDQELLRMAQARMQGDWENTCVPESEVLRLLGITEEDLASAEELELGNRVSTAGMERIGRTEQLRSAANRERYP